MEVLTSALRDITLSSSHFEGMVKDQSSQGLTVESVSNREGWVVEVRHCAWPGGVGVDLKFRVGHHPWYD